MILVEIQDLFIITTHYIQMNGIKVIHLIHQNVNSLQAKIGEIRYIADRTKAAVIGITESKLDKSTFQSEIQIDNCDLL